MVVESKLYSFWFNLSLRFRMPPVLININPCPLFSKSALSSSAIKPPGESEPISKTNLLFILS